MNKEDQSPAEPNGQQWNWLRRSGLHATDPAEAADAITPGEVLSQARAAVRDERWAEALELYEYFFDHALDGDPASFYGVRLSYCLSEWAALGNRYAPARERLEARATECLLEFEQSWQAERFHDYAAISGALGRPGDGLAKFLQYHARDLGLARSIGRFVWDDLVAGRHWSVCSEHLRNPRKRVEVAFAMFDATLRIHREHFKDSSWDASSERELVQSLTGLISVLTHSNRKRDLATLRQRIQSELSKRNRHDLAPRILQAAEAEGN